MNETVMTRMYGGREREFARDRNCVVEKADSRVAERGSERVSGRGGGGLLRRRYLRNCVVLSLPLPSADRLAHREIQRWPTGFKEERDCSSKCVK